VALEAGSDSSWPCPHGPGTAEACAGCADVQQLIEAQSRDDAQAPGRALRVGRDEAWGADDPTRGTGVLARARSVVAEVQRQRAPAGTLDDTLVQDIDTAVTIGLLSPRQGDLLRARLALAAEGARPSWRAMGRRCGCSAPTAKRHYQRALAVTRENGRGWRTHHNVVVYRERGSRQREAWIRHTDRFGRWSQTWGELVTDRRQRTAALAVARRDDAITTAIRSSAMRVVFGALIGALATPPPAHGGRAAPARVPGPAHNRRWAQRRLRRAQRGPRH
jgi:hypothetical protein